MGDAVLPGPMGMVHRDQSTQVIAFVDLHSQYRELKSDIDRVIASIVERAAYVGGAEVDEFERWFAGYCGTAFAIGVSSGTTALELALRALNIGLGDEVITVAHTFIASAAAISAVGAWEARKSAMANPAGTGASLPPSRFARLVRPSVTFLRTGERRLATAVLTPGGTEPDHPLPVLLDPYGGPHALRVQRSRAAFLSSQWLADQGFVVVVTDGRGTPGRGPAWERAVHLDLAGPEKRSLIVVLTKGKQAWFFKLLGAKDVVADNKGKFESFVQSVKFTGAADE